MIILIKVRRSLRVVRGCSPYRALLTIRCPYNDRKSRNGYSDDHLDWLLRIGDKSDQASIIVRTLTDIDKKTVNQIDGSIGLIYKTAEPKDPIVIQTINSVLVCIPGKDIIDEDEDEDENG